MRFARHVGLVLVGVVVGILLTGSIRASQLQRETAPRLSFIDTGMSSKQSMLIFIKDNKSGGCWLAVDSRQQGIVSLAVAPALACGQ